MQGVKPSSWGDVKTCCAKPEAHRLGCLFVFVCSRCGAFLMLVLETQWFAEEFRKVEQSKRYSRKRGFAPPRKVVSVGKDKHGRPGRVGLTLDCGHVVSRENRPDKPAPTKWTRCEECKPK